MMTISLDYWWLPCAIILLVGLVGCSKINCPWKKYVVIIATVIFAFYSGDEGYDFAQSMEAIHCSELTLNVSDSLIPEISMEFEYHEGEKAELTENAIAECYYVPEYEIILFGDYEQDDNISNGKEPIEWIVLDKDSDSVFVVSKYGLDCKKYNESYDDATWETCSLRQWLNSEFINVAFSKDEQRKIKNTAVSADPNPDYDILPGNSTSDKVFCLSILEAQKYFSSDETRKCMPTPFARRSGAYRSGDGNYSCYWLRSPGGNAKFAAHVMLNGAVDSNGSHVSYNDDAVRPAMRILSEAIPDSEEENQKEEEKRKHST